MNDVERERERRETRFECIDTNSSYRQRATEELPFLREN